METDKQKYMANLIEELASGSGVGPDNFASYAKVQQELLRRIEADKVFEDVPAQAKYKEWEDSVFDRVSQHKQNGENKLNMYAEQFQNAHGMDHKSYTEQWFYEETGEYIELEKVLEHPTFADFVGVYDIRPMSAYVASKLIIDESDFMGMFDLGEEPSSAKQKGTYDGVTENSMPDEEKTKIQADENCQEAKHNESAKAHWRAAQKIKHYAMVKKEVDAIKAKRQAEPSNDSKECCGGSDSAVGPHALGSGQYLQFRLRRENVVQYLDHSYISHRLKQLIPEDPMEPIYIFTASANGIMRFHPWGGIQRKLWHGYGDSKWVEWFPSNIAHAAMYGCFCFGVIYKERENYPNGKGEIQRGGRTIVMRYNRWAKDNAAIYAMVRQRADERDDSVPEQEGALSHQLSLLQHRLYSCLPTCCISRKV